MSIVHSSEPGGNKIINQNYITFTSIQHIQTYSGP